MWEQQASIYMHATKTNRKHVQQQTGSPVLLLLLL